MAVVGAGPAGLVAAKHAIEADFEVTVFEASDDLGGQWQTRAPHSGVWPGMRTNTSRAMTAFSDFAIPGDHELHPLAEQVQLYLRRYAARFDVTPRIRFGTPVREVRPGWSVDGERFDAVVVASGRFRAPHVPDGFEDFDGDLLHAFDYPGAEAFVGRRVLVYGNGVSGHEIASDIAATTSVVSAYRKPRYVIQKVVDGVSSDWQWYTHVSGLRRRHLSRAEFGRALRARVLQVAGNPADFGAPEPDADILVAGLSLCQDYLEQVRAGVIRCRPGIASVSGGTVRFADGSHERVEVIICATGYGLDLAYLSPEIGKVTGPRLALHHRTFHPDLPGLGVVGQYATQGPYFPLLELQARWIAGVWSGAIPAPAEQAMRSSVAEAPPALDSHDALALLFSEAAGVSPDLRARPELSEALLFGPLLPPRYRFDGPGSLPDAPAWFSEQLAASPRAPVDPDDVALLPALGLGDIGVPLGQ